MGMAENEVFERTTINATSRILRHDDGTFSYEVVLGILPMDDQVRWESRKFKSSSQCVMCMFSGFATNVKDIINEYEP